MKQLFSFFTVIACGEWTFACRESKQKSPARILSDKGFDSVLLERDWPVAHATRGCDGREEGCESGYYDLDRDLDDAFLHLYFTSLLSPEKRSARGSSPPAASPS